MGEPWVPPRLVPSRPMGFGDVWNRTLVYFGIAEEEDWDEDGVATQEELERSYSERPNVRRLAPRRRDREYDDWTDPGEEQAAAPRRNQSRPRGLEAVPSGANVRVHLVIPRSFNDAQQIADKFKESIPVILNLQGTDTDLSPAGGSTPRTSARLSAASWTGSSCGRWTKTAVAGTSRPAHWRKTSAATWRASR